MNARSVYKPLWDVLPLWMLSTVLLSSSEYTVINGKFAEVKDKHTIFLVALCPSDSCSFLPLGDSAAADGVRARPAVLINDLLASFRRLTETLWEAGCATRPRSDRLLFCSSKNLRPLHRDLLCLQALY